MVGKRRWTGVNASGACLPLDLFIVTMGGVCYLCVWLIRSPSGRCMDELRTSATPTIGDIPDSWTATRVDLVGTVRTGLARSAERQTGRYATKYLRSANITANGLDLEDVREMDFTPEERVTFRLLPGDILLNEASGSSDRVGRAAIWRGEIEGCCYQNHLIRFRPHAVVPEYALIVFQDYAAAGVFARTARGVGIQHLGASRFAALPFPLPPLAEQGRIAEATNEKLGQIREAASRLHSAVNNLSAQTREIVAAATSGTLLHPPGEDGSNETSSVQTHRPKPEETPGIQTVEPLRFNSIPINWTWTTIGEVGDAKLGRQRSPAHHHGPNMRPYLRVANVLDDRIETSDVLRMNFEPQEAAEYELRAGDILLNEGQSPELAGRAALYRARFQGRAFRTRLFALGRERVSNQRLPCWCSDSICIPGSLGKQRGGQRTLHIWDSGDFALCRFRCHCSMIRSVSRKKRGGDLKQRRIKLLPCGYRWRMWWTWSATCLQPRLRASSHCRIQTTRRQMRC